MITKLVKVDAERPDLNVLREAADILRNGGLVAFPTETVYGLGANGLDAEACKKIYEAKGRPSDNPLILTIGDLNGLYPIVNRVTENAEKIIKAFWPGPITLVLPKADCEMCIRDRSSRFQYNDFKTVVRLFPGKSLF